MVVLMLGALAISGCTCGTCDRSEGAEEVALLPKGFCVLTGLGEADYDEMGWPRYIVDQKDGSVMVLVTPDRYIMGSRREPAEMPPHPVQVDRFYIDLYETNNIQFARFVKDCPQIRKDGFWNIEMNHWNFRKSMNPFVKPCQGLCGKLDNPALADHRLTNPEVDCLNCRWKQPACMAARSGAYKHFVFLEPSYFTEYWAPGVNDSHPARAVSFWEAWYYCRWAGKDLPTEAEWELAAGGGRTQLYPWGNLEPDAQRMMCNYGGARPGEDGYEYTAPVSMFDAGRSPFGVYNMAGNVWEWCKDNYSATAYTAGDFAKGQARQSELDRARVNPLGPQFGDKRVIRGGAYTSTIYDCRVTAREAYEPNFHPMNVGFRGVLRVQ